jgi:hypothetical protein
LLSSQRISRETASSWRPAQTPSWVR